MFKSYIYKIAVRYFFSKDSKTIVNRINGFAFLMIVSASCVLLVVLSAFAGLKDFGLTYTSSFDPDLKIVPKTGSTSDFINPILNNIFAPVENILGKFETYVYTKETFDPAPRIFQECKYYKKDVIYLRDKNMKDGGNVYWKRDNNIPDINPILEALDD